ncbi:MAG TPA: pitrilysin family protein [Anaerolineales bacterium]|nr:pitrilysin family protein [Anaerolineales bacterium]
MCAQRKSALPRTSSLPGPDDIHRKVLPNGITVLCRANFNSPSVSINGYVKAGSLFEPDEKLGLANFASAALMRGTQKHSFDSLYNELESVGASLGFDSGIHTTGFHGRALVEDLTLLLDLLSEALRQPTFPEAEVEKLRHQLLTGLAIRAQDTSDMADLTFDQILFHDHPYARPEDGFPETIQAIRRQDLVDYHGKSYGPRGTVIALVGAMDPKRAIDLIGRVLGDWKNPNQAEPPKMPELKLLEETVQRHVTIDGKSQADLIIGTNGPRRTDEDYLAASLGNSVLGQFGMYGRIGDAVREKSGLAYYAYSNLSAGMGPGSWSVSAGVSPANVKKAGDLIIKELKRFVKAGVTQEELSDSQANFTGRLPLSLESNGGVAGALINIERYSLGLDYYRRYPDLVKSVTRAEVLEVARKYIHPDRLAIAAAGS